MTVVRGTGLEPPRKKFGPPPMMSRESNSSAKAPPAVADSSAMAAIGAAKYRIIFPPAKIDSTEFTGHICGVSASHGLVRRGILNGWRYQTGNRANLPESISQTSASPRGAGRRRRLLL